MARPRKTELELVSGNKSGQVTGQEQAQPVGIMGIPLDKLADIPVEQMERLFDLHQKMEAAKAQREFDAAMSEMQPKLPIIDQNGRIIIRDKVDKETIIQSTAYARYEDIIEEVTPLLAEHGFSLRFRAGTAADGKLTVTAILGHKAGHREENTLPLMHDGSGSKNAIQAVGSSVKYGQRYTTVMILNIITRGTDDDGNSADQPETISDEQIARLKALIKETSSDEAKYLAYLRVDSLADIVPKKFKDAEAILLTKKRQKASA